MSIVHRLPAYTLLPVEVESAEGLVSALKAAAAPKRIERVVRHIPAPQAEPQPRFVERYFRSTVNGETSIITLTQLRQRSQGKPNTLLFWAERCWIGDTYDSRFVDVVRISPEEAKQTA